VVIYLGMTSDAFGERALPIIEPGVLAGAALIFFVYLGFEEIANLAEETKQPEKHLPKAIYISLVITTVLYILVALSVLALATPELLASSNAPLSEAVRRISTKAATGLAIVALFSTANTALITLLSASRMLFSMARDGAAPRIFARVIEKRKSPWTAAILVLLLSFVLLPFKSVSIAASISSFGALIAFGAVNLCLILLAWKQPELRRPFKAPFRIGRIPITGVLGLASIGLLLLQFDLLTYGMGAIVTIVGVGAYILHVRTKKTSQNRA
jgi:basic amino acid/polyamine antiporter, APA family